MTEIEPCPKCKKRLGYIWHWSSSLTSGDGYSECKSCEAIFK